MRRSWWKGFLLASVALCLLLPGWSARATARGATSSAPAASAQAAGRSPSGAQAASQGRRRVLWVPGETYPVADDPAPRVRGLRGPAGQLDGAPRLVLQGDPPSRPAASAPTGGIPAPAPLQIGAHRPVPEGLAAAVAAARLDWRSAPGAGAAASLVVTSPGAAAVRVAIAFPRLPAGAEVRFTDATGGGPVEGPYAQEFLTPGPPAPRRAGIDGGPDRMDPGEPFWSPVIEGDTVAVEIWIPDIRQRAEVEYRLQDVAHLFVSPLSPEPEPGAPCSLPVACRERLLPLANAVAKQVFEQEGRTYTCTGQLLTDTDPDTFKPYYATAAHCLSSAAGARTGTFLWFFQRLGCPVGFADTVQTAGGGRLLATTGSPWYAHKAADFTLIRLRRPPPAGVVLSGWTNEASEKLLGSRVDAISHPHGQTKLLAGGTLEYEIQMTMLEPGVSEGKLEPPYTHYAMRLELGRLAGGSSGSGIWVGRHWPEQYLIGVLTSGGDECPSPTSINFYGAFDRAFRKVHRWLAPRKRKARD